jgi:hypothetical protein
MIENSYFDVESTLQNRLISIDDAISKIEEGAQEYRIGNRTLRRADLSVLYKERRQLQYELSLAYQRGGGMSVATFTRD